MTGVTTAQVLVGGIGCAGVGVLGAAAAAHAWRGLKWAAIARGARGDFGILEAIFAVVGLIGTASVETLGLLVAWGGSLDQPGTTVDDPVFVASLLGTAGGHLAVLAWAASLDRATLGIRRPDPRWLGWSVGIAGIALAWSAGWTLLVQQLSGQAPEQDIVTTIVASEPGIGRVAALLFVVIGAPALEELVFRGYLQGTLSARLGPVPAIVAVSTLFGLFHLADPAVVPALVGMGALFGWLRERSGSILPSLLAHLLNNFVAMMLSF